MTETLGRSLAGSCWMLLQVLSAPHACRNQPMCAQPCYFFAMLSTAGPKMRKWYGQQSSLPQDGGVEPDPEQQQPQEPDVEHDSEGNVVLVTDADTPTGELVVLQLILLRANIRIVVKDTVAAKTGYGPYVEPVSVDINSPGGLARALKGVCCVVVLGKLGGLLPAVKKAGVERLVLLSTAGMPQHGGLAALLHNAADAALKEPQREAAVASSSIPHVIIKTGIIQDVPGGNSSISISPSSLASSSSRGTSGQCSIPREDLASAVVASVVHLPGLQRQQSGSSGLVFEVQATGPGQPPADWEQMLEGLLATPTP
eukprot:GHRR01021702.1.p1 GENE.GHRR01021702.1~~GHRR01021702.1.p1  ORF type:complete len:314 (+),score=130.01 GHRR01021702.1:841-1782(+)